ncbi:uncharacterized protein LOC125318182 isoform X2 [Corvus hawaiiensis]|uniref:uncharacterized protein LOC125318182 isoform X2 n=1 Tax=Corvus hawaiiensis TaxID=134902 RepID=UPI002018E330|nr:uncharacterized protein LOC125318182 isoform X2 [Corvus hawaiiensis]
MGPSGFRGLCLALLCSGAALGFQEEEPGNGSVTLPEESPGPPGHPTTATGHAGTTVTTWPRATTGPPWSGDLAVTPAGNQTRTSSGVPVRYWSPVLFVLLALLVLFVTYQKTKGKGIQDRAMSGSDSSAPSFQPFPRRFGSPGPAPRSGPHPKNPGPTDQGRASVSPPIPPRGRSMEFLPLFQRERKDPETPPGLDQSETTFSQPEPSQAPGVPEEREFLG